MHQKLITKRTFSTFLSQNHSVESNYKYSTYLTNITKPFTTTKRFKTSSYQDLTQIENDFHNLRINNNNNSTSASPAPSPTPFTLDNSYDCIMNRIPWYEEYLNDLGEDDENENETSVSSTLTVANTYNSFSIESDYIDENRIQGKIITNALESEKTLNKYFAVCCKMFPTK